MQLSDSLNLRELQRYLGRVGDRWPLQMVALGGARVTALRDGPAAAPAWPAERPEPAFLVVLVSDGFDGVPWLERVHQASALWDGLEMGDAAELHCYTPAEYLRRRESTPAIRTTAEHGLLLYADSEPFTAATAGTQRGV